MISIGFFCYMLGLLAALQVAATNNDTCSDGWVYVDIHYRAVNGRSDAYSYGLFIGSGTSSQNQSLWPSITSNETRLASNDFCGQRSSSDCQDARHTHGHFGSDVSSSWKLTPDYQSLDAGSDNDGVNVTYGIDSLNIYTHYFDPSPPTKLIVQDHAMTVMSDYVSKDDVFFHSGSLGLGSSSSLMKQLMDMGRISRNVVGFYLGTAYPRAGGVQNGSVVLGGYDAGRLEGDVHKYSLVTPPSAGLSSLKVHVKQVSLITQDGSAIALVTDEGFDGYISTSQYELEMPELVTKNLASALGASPATGSEHVLQTQKPFAGNLSITLDDGYEIVFPSEWISNSSGLTPFSSYSLRGNTSSQPTFVLGAAFLHKIYTTIDYDASAFYLAGAKVDNNYVQPQSLCINTIPKAISTPSMSKFVRTGMIGAIIGGIFAGIGILWLLTFCLRRHLQQKQSKDNFNQMEGGETQPKRSILRKDTKLKKLLLRRKETSTKSVVFDNVKRFSQSDSETSSVKETAIDVGSKDTGKSSHAGIELSSLKASTTKENGQKDKYSPVSPIMPPHYATTTLPDPNRFSYPYLTSPIPTPLTADIPRTGNPLLGGFQQYSQYDDSDNSDLYPPQCREHERGHRRVASDHLRTQMGLRVTVKPSTSRKSAPSPIQVKTEPTIKSKAVEADKSSTGLRKYSILRRVFPSS